MSDDIAQGTKGPPAEESLPGDEILLTDPESMPTPLHGTRTARRIEVPRHDTDGERATQMLPPTPPASFITTPATMFTLRAFVARGGCGEVWEAIQPTLSRVIAVKRIREDIYRRIQHDPAERKATEALFRQEALITASLEHPNILPVYDMGRDDEHRPVLSMKLVRGTRWDRIIAEDQKLSVPDFLDKHLSILIDTAQAVGFAHSRGIIHRDLKPSQVMVGEFGEVLLMDWGLAVVCDLDTLSTQLVTPDLLRCVPTKDTATNPAGSPAYMAPEQTDSDVKRIGVWTDIFLLGGTLYHILTGDAPYAGGGTLEAFERATNCEVIHPASRAPHRDVPHDLAEVAMRCLKRNPEERIGSVREFIDAIRSYLTGAGRRRESRALTEQVSEKLHQTITSYSALADLESLITRAMGLWPENPIAGWLRQRVLQAFVQLALENGDLVLARVQAERLMPSPEREEFLNEIRAMEKLSEFEEEETIELESQRRKAEERAARAERHLGEARMRNEAAVAALAASIKLGNSLLARAVADPASDEAMAMAIDLARGALREQHHPLIRWEAANTLRLAAELYLRREPKRSSDLFAAAVAVYDEPTVREVIGQPASIQAEHCRARLDARLSTPIK